MKHNHTMKHNRVVFWQVNPSPHQAPFIRALADILPAGHTTAVFQSGLKQQRIALGWHEPDFGNTTVIVDPDNEIVEDLVSADRERSVHIFSSISHNNRIHGIFRRRAFGSQVPDSMRKAPEYLL